MLKHDPHITKLSPARPLLGVSVLRLAKRPAVVGINLVRHRKPYFLVRLRRRLSLDVILQGLSRDAVFGRGRRDLEADVEHVPVGVHQALAVVAHAATLAGLELGDGRLQ